MAYKIYYKNTLKTGALSTKGKFEQYDRKAYATKQSALNALKKYQQKFKGFRRAAKKEGIKEYFEVRSVSKTKKRSGGFGFDFGGF